jgi:hypothetical protein
MINDSTGPKINPNPNPQRTKAMSSDRSTTMKSESAAAPPSEGRRILQDSRDQRRNPSPRLSPAPLDAPFIRQAGWLCIAAGALFLIAQIVMVTFDQTHNLQTSQHPIFIAAKIIYLAGFIVLMFALIAVYGLQASRAGRLGVAGFGLAIVGTMMLGGDLWFESFAVPWLAAGPGSQGLTSPPSVLMGLGAISSYILFAAGWVLFGIASVRARVIPLPISLALILGGIAGYWALLAPGGIPLGVALTTLGIWIVIVSRSASGSGQ